MNISASRFASWTLVWTLALLAAFLPSAARAQSLDPLTVRLVTDKSSYARGESALLTLEVKNTGLLPVTVSFSNGQRYDFTASDASGATVWTWSSGQTFDPNPSQMTLAAGQTWTVQETWTFTDDAGNGVADGDFVVSGTFLGNYLGRSGTKSAQQTVNLTTPDPLQVSFSTDRAQYPRTVPARMTLTITNIASYAVTIHFPTEQRYDFTAWNATGQGVWAWSHGKTFQSVPADLVLAPGESVQYVESWSFVGDNGLPVMAGTYTVRGTFAGQWYGETGTKSGESTIVVSTL